VLYACSHLRERNGAHTLISNHLERQRYRDGAHPCQAIWKSGRDSVRTGACPKAEERFLAWSSEWLKAGLSSRNDRQCENSFGALRSFGLAQDRQALGERLLDLPHSTTRSCWGHSKHERSLHTVWRSEGSSPKLHHYRKSNRSLCPV